MKTLYDTLGIQDPAAIELAPVSWKTLTPEVFCRAILESLEFRRYILNGILLGDISAAIILRVMDTGWGKVVTKLEVRDTTDSLDDLSLEQLEQRAMRLTEMVRQMKDQQPHSVH